MVGVIDFLFSFGFFTFVVASLTAVGIGVLALAGSDDFKIAKACFVGVGLYSGAELAYLAVKHGNWYIYPLFALLVTGCLWFCIEASRYVDRKREDKFAKESGTDYKALMIRRLEGFVNEAREIDKLGTLAQMGAMFTFRGQVEHFLTLHLSDDHVSRFKERGVYALEEMIKELIDGAPIPVLKNSPTFQIHKLFEKAYSEHGHELGQPKSEAEPLKHAYLAQYDKAQVIWNENAGELYRLHMIKSVWVSAKDLLDDDLTWFDDRKNSERFSTPEGKLPPWGGPARLRAVNPKDWSIGWRHWHFYHTDGATSVQRFERGLIIGPFRRFPSDDDGAQVYALTGDGTDNPKWYTSVSLGVSYLVCVKPMDLVPAPQCLNDRTKASLATPKLQTSVPSGSTVPNLRQEKVDGWRDMIAQAQSKFKGSGLSLIAILEQDSRFESFRRHLSTGGLQALQSGTGVKAKDLRSFDDVITMLEDEIIRVEENWGLR